MGGYSLIAACPKQRVEHGILGPLPAIQCLDLGATLLLVEHVQGPPSSTEFVLEVYYTCPNEYNFCLVGPFGGHHFGWDLCPQSRESLSREVPKAQSHGMATHSVERGAFPLKASPERGLD